MKPIERLSGQGFESLQVHHMHPPKSNSSDEAGTPPERWLMTVEGASDGPAPGFDWGTIRNEQTTQEGINSCKTRFKQENVAANDDVYAVAMAA